MCLSVLRSRLDTLMDSGASNCYCKGGFHLVIMRWFCNLHGTIISPWRSPKTFFFPFWICGIPKEKKRWVGQGDVLVAKPGNRAWTSPAPSSRQTLLSTRHQAAQQQNAWLSLSLCQVFLWNRQLKTGWCLESMADRCSHVIRPLACHCYRNYLSKQRAVRDHTCSAAHLLDLVGCWFVLFSQGRD